MRIRPTPGVQVASVDADGRLELRADSGDGPHLYRCGPVATAMWIALRRNDGDAGAAASLLAQMWDIEPDHARADLDIWVEDMRDAGLLRAEPSL
ncbi:PqqD family protein [Streptomyces yangpuensis]|uniref:PqqD family protein n=1 Tax=Streptomyces yangpuensis TaxID=1648182 RepID=A0ABY5Q8G4_9ACTN|nr:PqqD family protein [Streptomyces yangpuensis]UUY52465.1 PqqD family protein [Streptomyces yangpuensis]